MASRPKTHFVMDDRGLGGTFMIQQQFLDMYRKIHQATKIVDDEPPRNTVLKRPYFSRFGDYYNRVPPNQINQRAKAVVDTSAPESYGLIANLYINQGAREEGARQRRRHKKVQQQKATSSTEGAGSRPGSRPSSARSTRRDPPNSTTTSRRDHSSLQDIRSSLDEYVEKCDGRKKQIDDELRQLQRRRLLRLRGVLPEGNSTATSTQVAAAVIETIDAEEGKRHLRMSHQQGDEIGDEGGSAHDTPTKRLIPPTPPKSARPATAAGSGGSRKKAPRAKGEMEFGPPLSQLKAKKKDVWSKKRVGDDEAENAAFVGSPARYRHRSPTGIAASSPGHCGCSASPSAAALVSPYGEDEDW